MAAPAANNRWLQVAVVLIVALTSDKCLARPQGDDTASTSLTGARQSREEPNFSPNSWQPVAPHVSGVVIDQAHTSVRVEKSEQPFLRDARSRVDTEHVVSSPHHVVNESATTTRGKSPSPLGDAIKMVANQLLQSRGAVDEADVRTPPKTKTHSPVTEEPSHNGVAIPVILEEEMERIPPPASVKTTTSKKPSTNYKKTTLAMDVEKKTTTLMSTTKKPSSTTRYPVTTKPDGLTTWVYLSGSSPATIKVESTETPYPTTKTPVEVTTKKIYRTTQAATVEKTNVLSRKPSPLFTSSGTKPFPQRLTKKPVEEITLKNATSNKKESVSSVSSNEAKEKVTKKPETTPEIMFRRRPPVTEVTSTTYKPMPTAYSIRTSTEETTEEVTEITTEVNTEPTTKRTRLPGEKKKKNKNKRRRRPTKKPVEDEIESKIDNDTKLGKIKPKPMGTRIYNYLAREVMPSVGVGLIGLVGLASLAGLILYPFGGGTLPIRRNYNESPSPNYYYYDKERNDGSQNEEEVFGKVLAGMKDPSYVTGEQYPDVAVRNPSKHDDKYTRYDVDTGSGQQQGSSEYNRYRVGSQEKTTADSYYKNDESSQQDDDQYNRYNVITKAPSSNEEEYDSYGMGSRVNTNTKKTSMSGYESGEVKSQTRDSSRVEVKKSPQAPQYASRTEPRPVYLSNDWGVVKTDMQEASTGNKPQAMMYRGEEEPIYGQNAREDSSYDAVQSPQYSGVSRVGVGQRRITAVEHGPRRLRRESNIQETVADDESENEIDMDDAEKPEGEKPEGEKYVEAMTTEENDVKTTMPDETTVLPTVGTKIGENDKVMEDGVKVDNSSSIDLTNSNTTTEKVGEEITIEPEMPGDGTFFGFIRRVAQYKVRLGLSFLRNTSQAFSSYLDGVQKRVDNALKNNYRMKKRDMRD